MLYPVVMTLANFAQVEGGALTAVGAGWTVRDPEAGKGSAVAIVLSVPRGLMGKPIDVRLELLDHSGESFKVVPLDEDEKELGEPGNLQIEGEFVADGLDDPSVTIPLTLPLAASLPPFRLPPGQEFHWQLYLNDETRPEWALWFRTTPPEPPASESQ